MAPLGCPVAVVAVLAALAVPLLVSPAVTSVAVREGVSVELPAAQPGGRGSSQGLLNPQPSPEPLGESRIALGSLPNSLFLAPNQQEDLGHIRERLRGETFHPGEQQLLAGVKERLLPTLTHPQLTGGCTKLCTKLDLRAGWVSNPGRKESSLGRDHLCASGEISWIYSCRHDLKVNRNIPTGSGSALTHEQKHLWR